jgi:hypothetical protein
MALLAQFIVLTRDAAAPAAFRFSAAARAFAIFLVVVHLVLAPIFLPFRTRTPADMGRSFARAADSLPLDASLARQRLVVVNAPYGYLTALITPTRLLQDKPAPAAVWLLAPGLGSLTLQRLDDRTLRVRPARGFLPEPGDPLPDLPVQPAISKHYTYQHLNRLFCKPADSFSAGQVIDLAGLRVTITGVDAARLPTEAEFRFDVPLEDPSLRWMHWQGGRLAPYAPPRVGETVTLRDPSPS